MKEKILFLKPILHDLQKGQYWKQLFGWGLRVVAVLWALTGIGMAIGVLKLVSGNAPAAAVAVLILGALFLVLLFAVSATIFWIRSDDFLSLNIEKQSVFYTVYYMGWIVFLEASTFLLLGGGLIGGLMSLLFAKSPIGAATVESLPLIGMMAGKYGWALLFLVIPFSALYMFTGYMAADLYRRIFKMMDDVSAIRKKG